LAWARREIAHKGDAHDTQDCPVPLTLRINGEARQLDVDPTTPLLWVLRDHLGMTGTKFGCGVAQCGACTVHVNGQAMRSCGIAVQDAQGVEITTIEGLSPDGGHPLQKAWVELNVPQCGYCQAGMIMAAAALLKAKPKPTDADIDAQVDNLCRCGTYPRIRAAIHKAAGQARPV
jgi:isoquinoline 1-oxidoreductase alpha subunit